MGEQEKEKVKTHWGGEDTWYAKFKRWANMQPSPIKDICLEVIEWLWKTWVEGSVLMEMTSVDEQALDIVNQWEEEEKEKQKPIIESKPSAVAGLDDIRIRAPHTIDTNHDES